MANKGQKSYVSRSVYQKVCEENKRLKRDIYTFAMDRYSDKEVKLRLEYILLFSTGKKVSQLLKDATKQIKTD